MDLIGTLGSQLGIYPDQAQAVAGSVLGLVQQQAGAEVSQKLAVAVPELSGWQNMASALLGGGGDGSALGSLLTGGGSGSGLLGAAALVPLFQKLGVDAGKATLVAPIVLQFLKTRLDPTLVSKVTALVPLLSSGGQGNLGSVVSGLGGLFGKSR